MIVLIDCGMGNIGSIFNMLRKVGADVLISRKPEDIRQASKLILPGVGAFDDGIARLKEFGLVSVLEEEVIGKGKTILGICLGMQLFSKGSEEGQSPGLGWVNADTVRFKFGDNLKNFKVPHMGWNTVQAMKESVFFAPHQEEKRFYFVHSYHVVCNDQKDVLTTTSHGFEFVSALQKGNIIGVQFHPEKSHKFGIDFIKRFAEMS